MTGTGRARTGWLGAAMAALSAALVVGAAQAAPKDAKPRADIIGQVTSAGREKFLPVVILRGKDRIEQVLPYAPLYPRDRIFVTKRDATAQIEFYGGEDYPVSGR